MMNVKVTMRLMRLVQRSYSVALIVLPLLLSSCQPSPVEQWELDRPMIQSMSPDSTSLFFWLLRMSVFTNWLILTCMERSEIGSTPMNRRADVNEMPDYIATGFSIDMFCRCTLTVEGMWFDRDEAYSPYIILTDFDSIRYSCRSK